MLHEPLEVLVFDVDHLGLLFGARLSLFAGNIVLNGVDLAFQQSHSIALDLKSAGSTVLLTKEASLGAMDFVQLITVQVVRSVGWDWFRIYW